MIVKFQADKVKITGPKIDGTYTISFESGEYVWNQIKELPNMNGKTISVEVKDD